MYNFTRFERRSSRIENRISITKNYDFGLPSGFYRENGISSYQYAVFFFDDSKKTIGLFFTNNKKEKGSHRISHTNKMMGARISATAFLKSHGIEPSSYSGLYEWKKYEDSIIGTLYVIELGKIKVRSK